MALVGHEGVVGGLLATASMPSSCNAEVHIGGRASLISAAAFRNALDRYPGIGRLAARYDAAMMTQVQQNAVCNAAHKVEGRIPPGAARAVSSSALMIKSRLYTTRSRKCWAIRRTTVTLVAGNLEKDGVIICGRGYMQIVSRDALQRRSCECYGRVKGYVERLHAAHQQEIVARSEFSKPPKAVPV